MLSAVLLVGACGDSDEGAACEGARSEPLAPDGLIHVLPGAETDYLSDPPTSGPHIAWNAPAVIDRVLSPAEQVGVLESGDVLVQYRPNDVEAEAVAELESQLPDRAHLAPNPALPAPVVFTAHLIKQTCSTLDTEALDRFIADEAGSRTDQ